MKSVPLILAPGFRNILDSLTGTGCSVLDIFGAYDDLTVTGTNLSGWNQSGMEYDKIALALQGGNLIVTGRTLPFNVPRQAANVFGQRYTFILDEVTAKVNAGHRVNSNLTSLSDFIQDLAQNNSFDWYVESAVVANRVEVTIKTIDRSVDNIDLGLQSFLDARAGRVQVATSGVELRNEIACSVLQGAPVESIRTVNILGMANEPIDLTSEGGSANYFMTEAEMRAVLGSKTTWEAWVEQNGGFALYAISSTARPIISLTSDAATPLGIPASRVAFLDDTTDRALQGRIYQKLKGHAEATYGKRFIFNAITDVDYIDAAWTVDVVAGNNDANEYFRTPDGKTRCYIQFDPSPSLTPPPPAGGVFFDSFTLGRTAGQPQSLPLTRTSFDPTKFIMEGDRSDYILIGSTLFVAATVEEGNNIVRIDAPVLFDLPDTLSFQTNFESQKSTTAVTTIDGVNTTQGKREVRKLKSIWGAYAGFLQQHGDAYQPTNVHVPTRSKFTRYGPIFSSSLGADLQGRVEIIQDDGFAPWEFGGFQLMLDAMQFKVDNGSSSVKSVQQADVTVEGFPDFSIGESLGRNSNINNISVNFGNPVTTQYTLQSFLRQFGELSKEELALLSIYARRSGARTFPQNTIEFINSHRLKIQKQFSGRGSSSSSSLMGGAGSFE
jgi:hypothetical protein